MSKWLHQKYIFVYNLVSNYTCFKNVKTLRTKLKQFHPFLIICVVRCYETVDNIIFIYFHVSALVFEDYELASQNNCIILFFSTQYAIGYTSYRTYPNTAMKYSMFTPKTAN